MNPILRNTIALLGGLICGGIVNVGFVTLGPLLIALPEGADTTTMDGLKTSMPLLDPKHFIFPFLAHAMGTLIGAFIAAKFAASHGLKLALTIGGLFLLGGAIMALSVGGPIWFLLTDLLLAYLPMSYLGAFLARAARNPDKKSTEI